MNVKQQNGLAPVVKDLLKDFLSIMLLIVPGACLLLMWAGVMWVFLKHPDSTSANTQSAQPQASPSLNPSSTLQATPSQIGTPANTQSAQPQASPSASLEVLKDLQSKVEELRISNSSLKVQLDEMRAADSKISDLVIAALGSLVAVAVIIPSVNAISHALYNRDERNKMQEKIRAELRKELDQQIGEIKAYLLLKDYEISSLSISQTISGIPLKNIQDSIGFIPDNWFTDPGIKDKIRQIPDSKLRELKIHRYPLALQEISKALQAQKYLYSLDILPSDNLDILVGQQLKLFLSLLMLMTYPNEDKYILPRLSTAQINEFKSTFEDLNEYFSKKRVATECSRVIEPIREILFSDVKREYDFSRN